jgi:hypothetical protein
MKQFSVRNLELVNKFLEATNNWAPTSYILPRQAKTMCLFLIFQRNTRRERGERRGERERD